MVLELLIFLGFKLQFYVSNFFNPKEEQGRRERVNAIVRVYPPMNGCVVIVTGGGQCLFDTLRGRASLLHLELRELQAIFRHRSCDMQAKFLRYRNNGWLVFVCRAL